MRAIEFMANSKRERATKEQLTRWAAQARATMPDKDFKQDPELAHPKGSYIPTPGEQAEVRHAEGRMKDLWQKAEYERAVLKRKPTNEIQAANYAAVDRWHKSP
jgi:hypothetical protein